MKIAGKWTQMEDGSLTYCSIILGIDAIFHPDSGGYNRYDSNSGEFVRHEPSTIKPMAHVALIIRCSDRDIDDKLCLSEQDFQGEDFEDLKEQVERWSQTTMDKVSDLLMKAFL